MANAKTRPTDMRQRTTTGNRFRFLVRVLGLTGLLVVPAGWVLAADGLPTTEHRWGLDTLEATTELAQGSGGLLFQVGGIAILVGAVAVVLFLLTELVGGLFMVTGRKTAIGTNMVVQVGLAIALIVIVNAVSFTTYRRFDLTQKHQFTLTPALETELKTLRSDSPTTVVVLQLHKTAGTLSDKPDAYDYAAERKVVEKVKDLVAQLREFGPRFNVVVLDVEDEGYERAVKELTRKRPGLADAIANAPENSIFFYADEKVFRTDRTDADRLPPTTTTPDPDDSAKALVYPAPVTRLGFSNFYQLDKTGSKEATPAEREGLAAVGGGLAFAPGIRGKGNLVLLPRGKEAFVRKVLALEERKPKVGLAVIHPLLASQGPAYDEYTSAGLRKSLEANGFEVTDVILKKGWNRAGPLTPASDTFAEYELDRAEARYNLLNLLASDREGRIRVLSEVKQKGDKALVAAAEAKTAAEKTNHLTAAAKIVSRIVRGGNVPANEELLRSILTKLAEPIAEYRQELGEITIQATEASTRYRDLQRNERATESRRQTDVKAKLKQYVEDCDILIVPRMTTIDLSQGNIIPPSLYNLSKEQAEVVKEFIKAGKPVLFAVGPTNLASRRGLDIEPAGDDVEKLLTQLGIELGKQTIITDVEGQAIAERQNDALGSSADVPPLIFERGSDAKTANPVTGAFLVTARAVDRKLDLKKSGYRPVYVIPGVADKLPFVAEIAYTVRESWNEEKPLPDEGDGPPKFDPAKPDDPKKGTHDEERRGPFPVGVAVEVQVPAEWYDPPTTATRPTVRVVVLGHGGLFTGKKLDPGQETLLLHTVNWLLKRDDRLPTDLPDDQKWRYPRADLTPREFFVWRWATFLGLPALTAYFGLIALMIRKVR